MVFQLQFLLFIIIFVSLQAEWIEISQKSTPSSVTKPKTSIRILKKSEVEDLFNVQNTTPSPQWVAYQKERFGEQQQQHNKDSQKLVVTAENQMKNSAKIIVPANNNNENNNSSIKNINSNSKNQIISTKTRVNVIHNKPNDELVEIPHLEPQTTTKRDMNHAGSQDYEFVENVDEETAEEPEEDNIGSGMERPSWQGFLKFIKRIQNYWKKHAGNTLNKKINYLKRLRDRLMFKIEEHFDMIWPSKDRPRRSKRSILGESKINFPPEFALMSINLLTFAVFLIKLILQVVRLLKSKHYKISGLGISTQPIA